MEFKEVSDKMVQFKKAYLKDQIGLKWVQAFANFSKYSALCDVAFLCKDTPQEEIRHLKQSKDWAEGRKRAIGQKILQDERKRIKAYNCDVCTKSFESELSLKDHKQRKHSNGDKVIHHCDICSKSKGFKSLETLIWHKSDRHQTIPKCAECDLKFESKADLKKHIFQSHRSKTSVSCEFCDMTFQKEINLNVNLDKCHTTNVKGDKPYSCRFCVLNKTEFESRESMLNHVLKEHDLKKPYSCPECPATFLGKRALHYHVRKCHTGENLIDCDMCDKKFVNKVSLKIHRRIHTGETPYVCHTCGKGFRDQGNFKEHMQRHSGEKPFSCDICGRSFAIKHSLKAHIKTHSSEKTFLCELCSTKFKCKNSLKAHMKSQHSNEPAFKCELCDKTMATQRHFENHLKWHEKNFSCVICQERFGLEKDLIRHQGYHTGEKPFLCELCFLAFSSKPLLVQHHKSLHSEDRELFQCGICGKYSTTKYLLKRHLKRHEAILAKGHQDSFKSSYFV